MRIPSDQKIEKQSQIYADRNPILLSFESGEEYDKIHDEYYRLRRQSDEERKGCPLEKGGRCNCQDKPLLQELNKQMTPLVNYLNEAFRGKTAMRDKLFQERKKLLLSAREAKIRWKIDRAFAQIKKGKSK